MKAINEKDMSDELELHSSCWTNISELCAFHFSFIYDLKFCFLFFGWLVYLIWNCVSYSVIYVET